MRKYIQTTSPIKIALSGAACVLAAATAGAITTDGTLDGGYGAALAVQSVETQFGDNQSELNAGYATIQGGNLHLMLTGNIEANFNKLNIFIDSKSGGQNVIGGSNPSNDGWAGKYGGFTFDTGFSADYMFIVRRGSSQFDLDYAVVGGLAGAYDSFGNVFSGSDAGAATTGVGGTLGFAFGVGYNGSNLAGVLGGTGAANSAAALAVTTGLELSIPLAALGNPGFGDTIRISAMQNNQNHDYLSNQMLGGLPAGQGNLGGDGAGGFNGTVGNINLNNYAGDQFFTIAVPEPTSLSLVGLGAAALLFRRRK